MTKPETHIVTIRMPLTLKEKLEQLAASEDRTFSNYCVRLLTACVEVKEEK